ncbi:MAG: hypothetical protein EBU90_07445 [Proteobacteria bacterium]|nr:hypothetical protein [Pseudomonadota bacterium]NBP13462.1 hypothetical protein [bacterium]
MRKLILLSCLLLFSLPVFAGPYGYRHGQHFHRHHGQFHHGWVLPALIGGAVVYAATRPDPVIVLQPNQVIIDGVIYTKQIMIINGIQQEILIRQ